MCLKVRDGAARGQLEPRMWAQGATGQAEHQSVALRVS